ncbi:MAG: DUF4266 domain-containing protein [Bacteroidetes bacterium]|nr:MAG: DUF4266 domain-containing protein [Bacteroidota bacterium]
MKKNKVFLSCIFLLLCAQGCSSVKPWQRAYLNDHEMKLGRGNLEKFQDAAHMYREGASGGGGKSSGGCGCN